MEGGEDAAERCNALAPGVKSRAAGRARPNLGGGKKSTKVPASLAQARQHVPRWVYWGQTSLKAWVCTARGIGGLPLPCWRFWDGCTQGFWGAGPGGNPTSVLGSGVLGLHVKLTNAPAARGGSLQVAGVESVQEEGTVALLMSFLTRGVLHKG